MGIHVTETRDGHGLSPPPFRTPDDVKLGDIGFWRRADRLEGFSLLRDRTPVSWHEEPALGIRPAGPGFWAVTRYADVQAVSRDPETFVSCHGVDTWDDPPENIPEAGMLHMDDPEHRRLRLIVSKAFTPPHLERLKDQIGALARPVVDRLLEEGTSDLVAVAAEVFPASVICGMMGVPEVDQPRLVDWTRDILGPEPARRHRANREMIDYGSALAADRRHRAADDLTTVIVKAEVESERLSDEEIGIFLALLMTAGIETTGTTIAQGLISLCQNPEELARWMANVDGMAGTAIEELVRFVSPVLRFRRTAARDTAIDGIEIKADQKVVMYYVSANRDALAFDEPDRLDLTRQPNRHVGFGGGGPHFCLGANLARQELGTFFSQLFGRASSIELAGEPSYATNDAFNAVTSAMISIKAA